MDELKLNIGAGYNFIPGFVNIDISPKADVSLDLNKDRLPYDNNSVDVVFSHYCLEHVENYLFALGEIHRVLKHGGRFLVGLPYVTSTKYHLINPYHHHNYSEYSFDFFDPARRKGSAAEENPIIFKKVFHRFHYMHGFRRMFPPLRNWCRRHLFNVVRTIEFGLLAVKQPHTDITITKEHEIRLIQEFDACLDARVNYSKREESEKKGD